MNDRLHAAEQALSGGDAGRALDFLIQGFTELLSPSSPVSRLAIGWKPADDLCRRVGEHLLGQSTPCQPAGDLDLYIATQLYAGGGHTAVIGDFVRASGNVAALLVTRTVEQDIYADPAPPAEVIARTGIPPDRVHACPRDNLVSVVRWIGNELRRLRPRRVFLFHHPQDAAAVAALQPGISPAACYLVHHADRQPCAGLYTRGVQIIDLTPFTAEFSRLVLQIKTLYAPLTMDDACPGARPPFLRGPGGRLTTLSSGAAHKFGPEYPGLIARVLQLTGGRHVHVGHLTRAQLAAIHTALDSAAVAPDRFQHVKWVPSLARSIWELNADLMIGSFPMGGARTSIEACCAATPLLAHHPAFSVPFGVQHVSPGLSIWRDIDELLGLIRPIDRAWLEANGARARAYFEKHHHRSLLRQAFEGFDAGEALPLPKTVNEPEELCHFDSLRDALIGIWRPFRDELPGLKFKEPESPGDEHAL